MMHFVPVIITQVANYHWKVVVIVYMSFMHLSYFKNTAHKL